MTDNATVAMHAKVSEHIQNADSALDGANEFDVQLAQAEALIAIARLLQHLTKRLDEEDEG
jgi:hypothetical protein